MVHRWHRWHVSEGDAEASAKDASQLAKLFVDACDLATNTNKRKIWLALAENPTKHVFSDKYVMKIVSRSTVVCKWKGRGKVAAHA